MDIIQLILKKQKIVLRFLEMLKKGIESKKKRKSVLSYRQPIIVQ